MLGWIRIRLDEREVDDLLRDAVLLDDQIARLQIGHEVAVLVEHADVHFNDLGARSERRRLRRLRLLRMHADRERGTGDRTNDEARS
ncbi:MAG TPA: hypothetical protein VN085_04840 [Vicinamibacterales bacterium]|nr:hypothetical protein [Vicinamibacterales bacterium]